MPSLHDAMPHAAVGSEPGSEGVANYYSARADKTITDYVRGNRRITAQHEFLSRSIPRTAKGVLVVGCGSGQEAHHIATRVARGAEVLAVDISEERLNIARVLFPHRRIRYQRLDVLRDRIEGVWDVIVLPDVYEHIPIPDREDLHRALATALAPSGWIVLTCPSSHKQASLRAAGSGLQIVDETVALADLMKLAADVGGELTYFSMVSVWQMNDYVHAMIERGVAPGVPLAPESMVPAKGWPRAARTEVVRSALRRALGIEKWARWARRRTVERRLGRGRGEGRRW